MTNLEKLEKRWKELLGRPNSEDEVEETLLLAKEIELERAKEISVLISELCEKGIVISSIWDLVNTKMKYPEAIDILIKHLSCNYSDKNKEGIIRSLTVKEARGKATLALINEYERTPKEKDNLRWIIGNAIATTMTSKDVDWIIKTVIDKSNRISRGQMIRALGNVKSNDVEDVLINLLNDDEVVANVIYALGVSRSKEAKERIAEFINSKDAWIKKEAKIALKKIE